MIQTSAFSDLKRNFPRFPTNTVFNSSAMT